MQDVSIETGTVVEIFDRASHPYTKALLDSNPKEEDKGEYMKTISGAPPLLYEKFTGCPYAARCDYATEECGKSLPEVVVLNGTHSVACHHYKEVGKEA